MFANRPPTLPPVAAEAREHSKRVAAALAQAIRGAGGALEFGRYMEICLYAPDLGYYVAGADKLGAGGDFVTAPEISPLFGRCLARQVEDLLVATEADSVLEFGAGSGRLAADLLAELARRGALPRRYCILELGAELRQRQAAALANLVPELMDRVQWLERLPEPGFRGVMLANELLDALPVRRFRVTEQGPRPLAVAVSEDGFEWRLAAEETGITVAVRAIETALGRRLDLGYESEYSEQIPAWMRSVGERLAAGALLLIDYGYTRAEYYHPERDRGTLLCHFRHRAHFDPLILPGIQDISASVDFTAVAEAGIGAGLDLAGYTSQAWFLLGSGLEQVLLEVGAPESADYLEAAGQAKQLTLPGEMGERFQVLAFTRGIRQPLRGFSLHDRRDRLAIAEGPWFPALH